MATALRVRSARGATLFETLVGLVVLGLVATLGLSSLGLVGRAGAAAAADAGALAAVHDLLRLRVLSALPLASEGPSGQLAVLFEGEAERLAFVAPLPARFGTFGPALLELSVLDGALRLRWRPLAGAAGGEGAEGRVLLDGVAGLRLRYFGAPRPGDAPAWRNAWTDAGALPGAVELVLALKDGDPRRWPPLIVAPRRAGSPLLAAPGGMMP
jgi:general secretion pathway protein J